MNKNFDRELLADVAERLINIYKAELMYKT